MKLQVSAISLCRANLGIRIRAKEAIVSGSLVSYPLLRAGVVDEAAIKKLRHRDPAGVATVFELDLIRQASEGLVDRLETLENTMDEGIRAVVGGLEDIGYTLRDIRREVTEGFDVLIDLGEREVAALEDITRLLESPLDTQAAELRRRGLWAYSMELHDKALADLSRAVENNPYDYVCYLHIGHIHLIPPSQSEEALHAYEEAALLALTPPPDDERHSDQVGGWALMGQARSLSDMGRHQEAVEAAQQAANLLRDDILVRYELARCAAIAGAESTADEALWLVLRRAPNPCAIMAAWDQERNGVPFSAKPFVKTRETARKHHEELQSLVRDRGRLVIEDGLMPPQARRAIEKLQVLASKSVQSDEGLLAVVKRNRQLASRLDEVLERFLMDADGLHSGRSSHRWPEGQTADSLDRLQRKIKALQRDPLVYGGP